MFAIFQYALLSLARRWKKQVALMGIYSFVVAFLASIIFLTAALRSETQIVLSDLPELWVQNIQGGRLVPMEQKMTDSLRHFRGIKQVLPRIWGYWFDSPTGALFTLMAVDSVLDNGLVEYETIKPLDSNEVLVGTGLLAMRNLQIGDFLSLSEGEGEIQTFKIVGTFRAESDLISKDLLLFNSQTAKKLLGLKPEQMTDLALRIHNPDEVNNLGKKIDAAFPTLRIVTKRQLQASYQTAFDWRGRLMIYGFSMSLMAFLVLAFERAAGLNNEERQEVGLLKGLGWQITDVLHLKMYEGLIMSLSATLSGICLAYVHVFFFDAAFLKSWLVGWAVLYPTFNLNPNIDLESVLLVACFSLIPYLAATLIPAWRAALTEPSEILRG